MGVIVNTWGQIVEDTGIEWAMSKAEIYSFSPRGYFMQAEGPTRRVWVLYRKNKSSYPEKVPFVRQVLGRGTVSECMRIAEIYEVRRV